MAGNPDNPQDPRLGVSRELAELLTRPDGLRTARLLELAGILRSSGSVDLPMPAESSPGGQRAAEPDAPRPIRIWTPETRTSADGTSEGARSETVFVRPEPGPFGDHHAQRLEIPARKPAGTLRIGWFGESAAAGYLYAPHITPAQILEQYLDAAAVPNPDSASSAGERRRFDVVDLARTNETLDDLLRTAEAALAQLDLDAAVVFTGNNWKLLETPDVSPYLPNIRARQRYALALRSAGLAGPPRLAERQLERKVTSFFDRLAALVSGHGVPAVIVIPEVNHVDWESRQPVPWLPGDGVAKWYAAYERAVTLLTEDLGTASLAEDDPRDFAAILEACHEMLDLDGGRCATSHRLRARALLGRGKIKKARQAIRDEVDAAGIGLLAFLDAPRLGGHGLELLRAATKDHGFAAVDLPNLFAADAEATDRQHFLDYCHLTLAGLQRALAATAAVTLRTLDVPRDVSKLAPPPAVELAPAHEALAHLGAAIHSAHRLLTTGPRGPLLQHWCRHALETDPSIAATFVDLLEARCATPLPAVLTAAQQRNRSSEHVLHHAHGWRWNDLDADVLLALCRALEAHASTSEQPLDPRLESTSPGEFLVHALSAHRPTDGDYLDLTQSPYRWQPLERFYPEAMDLDGPAGHATYRCPWPEASFCLPIPAENKPEHVQLELTVRLPPIPGLDDVQREGNLSVYLDGRRLVDAELSKAWSKVRVEVPAERLHPGLARLSLRWPMPPPVGEEALDAAIQRLEQGIEADVHPVFGEIYSIRVWFEG